eukprot:CAMPEP_0175060456 /NCGR_PEP_ID=MMETSP0052_2-20121109/13020_1 /TAXON_ID=51329 ORGANISM="Polytomella parva, Strain SAG 63-3" /NCGR_SAMPLE_ID=MMETSP0052_2 /ASSEMBLY_ACC=CAM_ASM_000194 /LENGTH=178 /DNA_ID=CAMNT_0016326163 /DNA_START=116 /DNA_END=649 /DNA_ORIENTATION=+
MPYMGAAGSRKSLKQSLVESSCRALALSIVVKSLRALTRDCSMTKDLVGTFEDCATVNRYHNQNRNTNVNISNIGNGSNDVSKTDHVTMAWICMAALDTLCALMSCSNTNRIQKDIANNASSLELLAACLHSPIILREERLLKSLLNVWRYLTIRFARMLPCGAQRKEGGGGGGRGRG